MEEIVETFAELIEGPLAGKQIILTVSPVRHTGDTLAGNAVSKATLRLAAEQLTEKFKCSAYFPAFEILTDDLRDYRFYADDLVHPAPQAVAYVWEKFAPAVLTDEALRLLPEAEAIVAAAAHRPRNPQGEALPRLLPPSAGTDRRTSGDGFSVGNGLFPPMSRNKFVNLRPITHTQ